MKPYQILTTAFLCTLVLALSLSNQAMAHCDSMDGPVVKDAQRALSDKSVEPVLKWVDKQDEESILKAFELTLAVRDESAAAKTLADRYFSRR